MAYLSKEVYEGKKRYARKNSIENYEILKEKKIKNLDEIYKIVCRICDMRHTIHSSNSLWNPNAAGEQRNFLEKINNELYELNLPLIKFKWDFISSFFTDSMDLDNEIEYLETEDEKELTEDEKEELYYKFFEMFLKDKEQINTDIEKWLKEFDEKYGTHFKPTGKSRIF